MKTSDDLPQTGEGVKGEKLSSVPSSPTDFPGEPQGRVDLGNRTGYPRAERTTTAEETIPMQKTAEESRQDSIRRAKDGNLI